MRERLLKGLLFIRFHIRRGGLILWYRILEFLPIFYKKSGLQELEFFIRFFFHHYSGRQFNPLFAKENFQTLMRASSRDFFNANKEGALSLLSQKKEKFLFGLKNLLLFGALQARVEKVIFFTFLTLTLEIYNPFDKKILKVFLERKISLIGRILEKIKSINKRKWDPDTIRAHIDIYRRSSLLQYKIIQNIQRAYRRQKKQPRIEEGQKAIERGLYPILVTQGCSGSYWIRGDNRKIIGLFKPFDEEIHAPNNPIGPRYQGPLGKRRTRLGSRVGEAAHHEVGAFIVDSFLGFGIVPKTYYASFSHTVFFLVHEDPYAFRKATKTKFGSFQEFIEDFNAVSLVTAEERDAISLEEFQLLAVLDVIIGNTDRNTGNILIGEDKIAAIDHGLSFPDMIEKLSFWYWGYFKQGEEPLFPSLLELLENFPFERLFRKLRKRCFISPEAFSRMRERMALFTEGARLNLPLKKLEGLMVPDNLYPLQDLSGPSLQKEAHHQFQEYLKTIEEYTQTT